MGDEFTGTLMRRFRSAIYIGGEGYYHPQRQQGYRGK